MIVREDSGLEFSTIMSILSPGYNIPIDDIGGEIPTSLPPSTWKIVI